VLRTSKRPEPVNLVHCPSCDRHEPFCYSCRHRPTPKNTLRGNPGCAVGPKTPTPADLETLPRQSCATLILRSRRLGPPPSTNRRGTAQTVTTMGRTVCHGRGHTAGILPDYSDGWHRSGEFMEYRAPQKILPLAIPQNS
jgi:hypothetical protein